MRQMNKWVKGRWGHPFCFLSPLFDATSRKQFGVSDTSEGGQVGEELMAVLKGDPDGRRKEARCIMVGLQMNDNGRELLDWAIDKVAEQGDRIIAVTVCRDSDLKNTTTLSLVSMLEDFLAAFEGTCALKKVFLVGRVARGNSIRKALLEESKLCAADKVVVGVHKHMSLRGSALVAKYCAKKLPPTTALIAVQNGKVVFGKSAAAEASPGVESKRQTLQNILHPSVNLESKLVLPNSKEKTDKESPKSTDSRFENDKKEATSNNNNHASEERKDDPPNSVTKLVKQLSEPGLGWPLLQKAVKENANKKKADPARKLSVVQWAMALPDRNLLSSQPLSQLTKELNTILSRNNSSCKWFQYQELLSSTNQFSSENLIGKGGTGKVYRGNLQNGQQVAVKLSKLSAKASEDFLLEVDIITKLDHSHIVPLLGICIENNTLISMYEYFPSGNLVDNLHGEKVKHPLTWDMRFKVAMGIAEALTYLHHGCSQPVIHRDVKSANILLNDKFEPQLSDFGLAIYAPKPSTYLTQNDIVGTFGYLAPEYFMYGKVSSKIDVYAFGVVLLELLTGRKPIDDDNPKGEESLVMWGQRILEGGDLMDLLDPNLDANYDKDQMRRIILAASLCITRIARFRPAIDKICSLLKGEDDMETWICSQTDCMSDLVDCPDDEVYPTSSTKSHLSLALLNLDDNASVTSSEQSHIGSWEEYLRGRWSRSSSFN